MLEQFTPQVITCSPLVAVPLKRYDNATVLLQRANRSDSKHQMRNRATRRLRNSTSTTVSIDVARMQRDAINSFGCHSSSSSSSSICRHTLTSSLSIISRRGAAFISSRNGRSDNIQHTRLKTGNSWNGLMIYRYLLFGAALYIPVSTLAFIV